MLRTSNKGINFENYFSVNSVIQLLTNEALDMM